MESYSVEPLHSTHEDIIGQKVKCLQLATHSNRSSISDSERWHSEKKSFAMQLVYHLQSSEVYATQVRTLISIL